MATEIEQLRTLLIYGSDYSNDKKVLLLFPNDAERSRIFWGLLRDETQASYWVERNLWNFLHPDWKDYQAQELIQLWAKVLALSPDGTLWNPPVNGYSRSGHGIWDQKKLPGISYHLPRFLMARKDDADFVAGLTACIPQLPTQYQAGFWFMMAEAGMLSHTALPAWVLDQATDSYIKYPPDYYGSWGANVWPREVWGPSLLQKALLQAQLPASKLILELLSSARPEEVIALLQKSPPIDLEPIFREMSVEVRPLLAAALDAGNGNIFWLSLMTLKVQQAAVPAMMDDLIHLHLSNAHFSEFHKIAFAAFPQDRQEKILLAAKEWPFWLASACPTEVVAQKQLDWVMGQPARSSYEKEQQAHNAKAYLYGGEAMANVLLRFLKTYTGPSRVTLVQILGNNAAPQAAPYLASLLLDTAKTLRVAAQDALLRLPVAVVAAELALPLGAKKKDARLAAAELMTRFALDPALVELARRFQGSEKDEEIKKILEKIIQQAEQQFDPEVIRALVAQPDWKPYQSLGPILVPTFFQALFIRYKDQQVSPDTQPTEPLVELLQTFIEAPLKPALQMAMVYTRYYVNDYLNDMAEKRADTVAQVVAFLQAEEALRPPEAGSSSYSGTAETLVEWLCTRSETAAIGGLVWGLNLKDRWLREKVQTALVGHGAAAVPAVAAALDTIKPTDGRDVALEVLERFGTVQQLPLLQKQPAHRSVWSAIAGIMGRALRPHLGDAKALDQQMAAFAVYLPTVQPTLTLQWSGGQTLSTGALSWLLSSLRLESEQIESEILPDICQELLAADRQKLSDHLCGTQVPAYSIAVLQDLPRIEELGRSIETASSPREVIKACLRSRSDTAVRWLDHWSRKSKHNSIIGHCQAALNTMAKRQGCTVDALIEASIEDFGFNKQGERVLDYGPRQIMARLDEKSELQFVDEKGNVSAALPKARVADDAAKVAAIKALDLKKRVTAAGRNIVASLEKALSATEGWPEAVWRARFVEHGLRFPLSRRLIWRDQQGFFAIAEDGTPINVSGDPIVLIGPIFLAHPDLFSATERQAWQQYLEDYRLLQPFVQMARPPITVPDSFEAWTATLPNITGFQLMSRHPKVFFSLGPREDGGCIFYCYRQIGTRELRFYHQGLFPQLGEESAAFEKMEILEADKAIPFTELNVLLQKDILYWLGQIWF